MRQLPLGELAESLKYLALSVFPEWLSASELKAQEHSSPAFLPPTSTALSLFLLSGVLLGKGEINATHPSLPENTHLTWLLLTDLFLLLPY